MSNSGRNKPNYDMEYDIYCQFGTKNDYGQPLNI